MTARHESPYLADHHHQLRAVVRDFAEQEIRPIAREADLTSTFPWDTVKRMGELGFLGVVFPEEYGGSNTGWLATVILTDADPAMRWGMTAEVKFEQ